jgi:hypothetical protein
MDDREKQIEAIARAVCRAHGYDPDEPSINVDTGERLPSWRVYVHAATAAHAAVAPLIRAEAYERAAKYLEAQPDNGISHQALWRHAAAIRALGDSPSPGTEV